MTDIVRIPFHGGEEDLNRLPGKAPYGGFVYVISFNEGVVKVGSTSNPAVRIATHLGNAAPFVGGFADVWVSPLHDDYRATEKELIALALGMSTGQTRQEWFVGVAMSALVGQAEQHLSFPVVDLEAHKRREEAARESMSRMWKSAPGRQRTLQDCIADYFGRDGDGYRRSPEVEEFTSYEQLMEMVISLAKASHMAIDDVMAMDRIDLVELLVTGYVQAEALRMRAWASNGGQSSILRSLQDVADELPLTVGRPDCTA